MRYAQIRKMDISNGEGIGIALFTQGCHFHCKNCFNKETWDFNGGQEWTSEIKQSFLSLLNNKNNKRVSILGGEPLAKESITDILDLVKDIKKEYPNKKIWLYTGYTFEEIFNNESSEEILIRREILNYIDICIDGRYKDELRDYTLKFRGSSNQRIIDVKKTLANNNKIILYNN